MQTTHPGTSLNHRQIEANGLRLHVVESGDSTGTDFLLLHGWPEDWSIYEPLLRLLRAHTLVAAIDLPGIGASDTPPASGDKRSLAKHVRTVIRELGLRNVTLVGHDVGGQIVYAYLRAFPIELHRAVLMNIVVPGIDPWAQVTSHPHLSGTLRFTRCPIYRKRS